MAAGPSGRRTGLGALGADRTGARKEREGATQEAAASRCVGFAGAAGGVVVGDAYTVICKYRGEDFDYPAIGVL
jgi:hypothetical protein